MIIIVKINIYSSFEIIHLSVFNSTHLVETNKHFASATIYLHLNSCAVHFSDYKRATKKKKQAEINDMVVNVNRVHAIYLLVATEMLHFYFRVI